MLFEDLDVLGHEVLAAESADGHGLCGLDGGAVLVDLDAGAGGVGLLVLALDAVLLGDRHGEWWDVCGFGGGGVVVVISCGSSVRIGKLGTIQNWKERRPFFHKEISCRGSSGHAM